MTDLFKIAEDILDGGPIQIAGVGGQDMFKLTELIEGVARVQAFSLSTIIKTEEGLVVIDTGMKDLGKPIVDSIRGWSSDPFHTLIYTHGHVDHVGGSGSFFADANAKKHPRPNVIGHENILKRFARYKLTNGYNRIINERQMSQAANMHLVGKDENLFLDASVIPPDMIYSDHFSIKIGELTFDLHHALGETDDHTWVWIPERKALCTGDFFCWIFPNAGNPQKAQRYPLEWAHTLREMAGMGAEYCFPSHGWPLRGAERIRTAFLDVADVLEKLVKDTLEMMDKGATLNEILHTVKVDEGKLAKGYLIPIYDEPEFVVNNIWRLYGGWYDGNPANLKPVKDSAVASEVADMAGGPDALAERAEKIAGDGDLRLACHMIELASMVDPENPGIHGIRADIYRRRRESETSLMASGIYGQAEGYSREISDKDG